MKNLLFSLLLFLFSFHFSKAQYVNEYNLLNHFVQLPPQAASLGKYIDYPVNLSTGIPRIDIPVYQLEERNITLPIILSYHAGGIKVSEIASWVGLGWVLQAGGMIVRTVRGAPDEGSRISSQYGPKGYYIDSGLRHLALLPHPVNNQVTIGSSSFEIYVVPGIVNGGIDTEPDLFFFNFNGYMGAFVFDENKTPRLLTDDNIQISVNFDYQYNQFINWVITTPDGLKYYFGENNIHDIVLPHSVLTGDDPNSVLPADWLLTKIVDPNAKDTVYFNYQPEKYTYYDLGPETQLINFEENPSPNPATVCSGPTPDKQNLIRTTVNGYRLSSIKSKHFLIQFIADTLRQDLSNYANSDSSTMPRRLDSIKVFNSSNQLLETFAFRYTYFVSNHLSGYKNLDMIADETDTKRLKLLSFSSCSGDGTTSLPPYVFQYQDSFSLPRRLSYDQDHWGYSNSPSGDANSCFMPPVSYQSICSSASGANRKSRFPQMEAATLLSIQDPLGFSTTFQYEPNHVNNFPDQTVGGLRIAKITSIDHLTGRSKIIKYEYDNGYLFRVPTYIIKLQNEFYVSPPIPGQQVSGYQGYGGNAYFVGILKQSQSVVPLQDVLGNTIIYAHVREIFGEKGEGGSHEYTFYNYFSPRDNSRLSLYNFATQQYIQTVFYGNAIVLVGNGKFNEILPDSLQYYTGFDADRYFPIAPYQVNPLIGKLLREDIYDSLGNLLETNHYQYSTIYHENYWIRGLKVHQTYRYTLPLSNIDFTPPTFDNALTFYKLHTGISHLTLKKTTIFEDGKSMTTISKFGYQSPYHTLSSVDTTINSAGDTIVHRTFYSFDYADTVGNDHLFSKLKTRHLLVPILSETWKNGSLVEGKISRYHDFSSHVQDTFLYPGEVYVFTSTNPVPASKYGTAQNYAYPKTKLIPNTYYSERADFEYDGSSGLLISQQMKGDSKQTIIWDSSFNLPIAIVNNANLSDVAYSSFESNEQGNWIFNPFAIINDVSAPTGSHVFLMNGNNIIKSNLDVNRSYILSYWLKSGSSINISGATIDNSVNGISLNGWVFHSMRISNAVNITISGNGSIDELRLYPTDAEMHTYTYNTFRLLVAECAEDNTMKRYEYDGLGRLVSIKDEYGNIIKAFEYHHGMMYR